MVQAPFSFRPTVCRSSWDPITPPPVAIRSSRWSPRAACPRSLSGPAVRVTLGVRKLYPVSVSTTARTGTSHWVDIDGQTHYRDYGGPADGPLIVCIHGLGGSSLNWDLIARHLTDECRVVASTFPDTA